MFAGQTWEVIIVFPATCHHAAAIVLVNRVWESEEDLGNLRGERFGTE